MNIEKFKIMNVNKDSIWYHAANHGLIFGLINIVLAVIIYVFDLVTINLFAGFFIGIFNLVLFFIVIFMLTKSYRTKIGGYISYGKALQYGLLIGVFASLIGALYQLIFNTLIDPDYQKIMMEKIGSMVEEKMIASGLSEEMIEQQMAAFDSTEIPSPVNTALKTIPGTIIFTFIVSLITSIFVKKKNENAFAEAMNDIKETPENTEE